MTELLAMATCRSEVEQLCLRYEITESQALLLTCLIEAGGNLTKATKQAGLSRNLHYQSLRTNKDYARAYSDALFAIGNCAFLRLAEKAITGDILYFKGQPVVNPETGEFERVTDTVAGIYVSKAAGKFSDQGTSSSKGSAGTQINVIMPPNAQPPIIEVNQAEQEPPTLDG